MKVKNRLSKIDHRLSTIDHFFDWFSGEVWIHLAQDELERAEARTKTLLEISAEMRKECPEELHTMLEVCDALWCFQLVHDALWCFQLVAESSRN